MLIMLIIKLITAGLSNSTLRVGVGGGGISKMLELYIKVFVSPVKQKRDMYCFYGVSGGGGSVNFC